MDLSADFSERAIARMLNTGESQAASLGVVWIVISYWEIIEKRWGIG